MEGQSKYELAHKAIMDVFDEDTDKHTRLENLRTLISDIEMLIEAINEDEMD